ncbi:DUF11 domain-containing protein [Lachnospiraceae bacterium OttesenSCG-928-E19]|nr:DUF11 domain-containing protein [Lachnospiraceae bacterium OttesenSCG-928-E19]
MRKNSKGNNPKKTSQKKSFGFFEKIRSINSMLMPWQKLCIAILGILLIVGIAWWIFGALRTEVVTYEIKTDKPSAVQFTDDKAMNFMVNDTFEYSDAPAPVSLPEPNNERELTSVRPLRIYYTTQYGTDTPVFKSNLTDVDFNKRIKITPFIRGKWTRNSSYGVTFVPEQDWPADQKFNVTIDKKLFNNDVKITDRKTSFTTSKVVGKIESFNAYPDMTKNKSMNAIAVVSFNYAIDTKTFDKKVSVKLDGKNIDYTVKFDTFYRTAFITTDAITVGDKAQRVKMTLNGIEALNSNAKSDTIDGSVTIESADNFFKISNIETQIVDNAAGNPEQLVLLNLTSSARDAKWNDAMDVYLLPKTKTSDESNYHKWKADEITEEVLSKSKKLDIKKIDFANPTGVYRYAFSYDVSEKTTRFIYVAVKPGLMSDVGFNLKNGANKILTVPYPNKEVKIAGSGALLSLAGGKELAIMARGGAEAAHLNLYKVKSDQINHLISQTYNIFNDVSFKGYSFGAEDMSVVFTKKISFADTSFKRVNYASVNLGEYLNRTGNDKTGIFIVQVGSTSSNADYADKRLILLTDLGIIRKVNNDDTSVVFVSSLSNGGPVAGATVSVLGRNGNPIWTGTTNDAGRANTPKFAWNEYRREKEPVAFVVRSGNDVSFIPYNASYEQNVEYSKYDIDGVYASVSNPMNAFLFSDRGIYRPGEKFIIGGIVKEKSFKSLSGVPVKIEIRDARSKMILEKTFSLKSDGLFDISDRLAGTAPIGDYQIRLYSLTDKNKNKDILGTTSIRVEEFVPDTLKINSTIKNAKTNGWIKPSDLSVDVTLRNLFGTPATERRITGRAVLTPSQFSFPEFKGYTFTKNFIAGSGLARGSAAMAETLHQNLTDVRTDRDGKATLGIKFENNINPGTYTLSVTTTGFEGDSGRSVQMTTNTRVSDAEYLIGYKSSSDLGYIAKSSKRSINLIAINSDAVKFESPKLTMRVVKKETLTSLIKDYNDYYKYQTVTREKVLKTSEITIPKKGMDLNLDTTSAGTYYIQIIGSNDRVMAHIDYYVAGNENVALTSDQNAELKIKLDAGEYAPGSNISVSITSPYIGSGLITIEKDSVIAHKWFKTSTTSSVQTISLPDNFEGTGYINVSFVRDINSRDVFTTPYTYAVAPFAADKSKRTINVELKTADIVRDKKLTVTYKTDKSARMMIFAVNEGILQVGRYKSPKPLAHFFKKSALQVSTYQILSLLLPEYKILREFAKTGGGDYEDMEMSKVANVTNPFARVVDEPVAFYSGIVETVAGIPNKITFDIPDHFNGGVRVYAVAANSSGMGAASTDTKIQSPVIISASNPLMAVPGDEFTVNAVISNMTEKSGTDANVTASAKTSDNLTIVGSAETKISIPEMSEKLWTFALRANDKLGNADINITASVFGTGDKQLSTNTSKSTMSIRPASLFETHVLTNFETSKKISIKDFAIDMYDDYAKRELYVSHGSFVLVKPLFEYLNNYKYPCSEQTVSVALPYALIPNNEFLGIDSKKSATKIRDTINILQRRQNDDGSFAMWESGGSYSRDNESDTSSAYVTAYVVNFLTIAQENGFTVPKNMLSRGVDYLRTYAGRNIRNANDAITKAFAIYVVTRNGFVSTSYIDGFEEYANKNVPEWQSELSGTYIASAYKLLKQDDKAISLIKKYKLSTPKKFVYHWDFGNNITNDAMYAYMVNKHFDGDISADNYKRIVDNIQMYIASGNYSSFTSAVSVMALAGDIPFGDRISDSISVVGTAGKNTVNLHPIDAGARDIFRTDVPNNVTKLDINCNNCDKNNGVFYTMIQMGFPKSVRAQNNGIEVVRDYFDVNGDKITSATVGDDITVKISVRATGSTDYVDNVVIADLLPAGFSVVSDSISGSMNFSEPREDRVLIYKSISKSISEITYKVKVTAAGTFTIPAIQASSMYNPQINGVAKSGKFTVTNAKVD